MALENEELAAPPGFFIKYDDVRRGLYRKRKTVSQKSTNAVQSVALWIDDIESKGGKGVFLTDMDERQPSTFMTAWCTSFQLKDSVAKEMRPLLNEVRRAKSAEEMQISWEMFKAKYPTATTLIRYIEKNWINEASLVRWVSFAREGHQHIDTNNLIESWHKTLKKHHLGSERNVRADFLIYLLQGVVNQDFRLTYYKIKNGFQPLALSSYDKQRKAKAMALRFDQALELVNGRLEESKFMVKSFTGSSLEYDVAVDIERNLLLSCSCADYIRHRIPCKHFYLIVRIFNIFEIKYTPDPEPTRDDGIDDNSNDQITQDPNTMDGTYPPLPAIIPPHIQLLIQAERAKEREAQKRKREEEVKESFKECDAKLKELWFMLGRDIFEGKRKCTLSYMQAAVATLENARREVKGVNEIGAGRKCQ
ncbi:hypothetical protein BGX28_000358 [Mortierella sp. GBA30]|nr:hypothetical protein BGX28_000358 [Mortierella sp. GBA30]